MTAVHITVTTTPAGQAAPVQDESVIGFTYNTVASFSDTTGGPAPISEAWTIGRFPGNLGAAPAITNPNGANASLGPCGDGLYELTLTRVESGGTFSKTILLGFADVDGMVLPTPGIDLTLYTIGQGSQIAKAADAGFAGSTLAGTEMLLDAYLRNLKTQVKAGAAAVPIIFLTGAAGDDTTDDSAAFIAMFAAAPPGALCYIPQPAVKYKCGARIIISKSVTIMGSNKSKCIIRASAASFDLFDIRADDVEIFGVRLEGAATTAAVVAPLTHGSFAVYTDGAVFCPKNFKMHDFEISGPNATTGFHNGIKLDSKLGNGNAVLVDSCDDPQIHNFLVERLIGSIDGFGYGILDGGSNNRSTYAGIFKGSKATTPTQGRHAVYSSVACRNAKQYGNTVTDFNFDAFPVFAHANQPGCESIFTWGNTVDGSALGGTNAGCISYAGKVKYCKAWGNTISNCAGPGMVINDAGSGGLCLYNEMFENTIRGAGLAGIDLLGAQYSKIQNNRVIDCSQTSHGSSAAVQMAAYNSDVPMRGTYISGLEAITERVFRIGKCTGNAVNPSIIVTYKPFAIVDATNTSPVVIEVSPSTQAIVGDTVTVDGVFGNTGANGSYVVGAIGTSVNGNQTLSLTGSVGNGAYTGQGVVFARANHGAQNGSCSQILGALGNTAVNGERALTIVDATSFSVAVAGNGTWTSGGEILLPTHRNGIKVDNSAPVPLDTVLGHNSILPIFGVDIETNSNVLTDGLGASGNFSGTAFPLSVVTRDLNGISGFIGLNVGVSPATSGPNTGFFNTGATFNWYAKRGGGAGDISVLSIDGADDITVGDITNGKTIIIGSSTLIRFSVGGTVISIDASLASFSIPLQFNAASLAFGNTVVNPLIRVSPSATNGATGTTLTIRGQTMTGTTSIGGNVDIESGGGTGSDGKLRMLHGTTEVFAADSNGFSFNGTATGPPPTITGSRGGNVALADLLTWLATRGYIIDSTT